jgi:hypothetical protein
MRRLAGDRVTFRMVTEKFDHGHEPRAEEIALHQRFLTLQGEMETAQAEGNEAEVRRLRPCSSARASVGSLRTSA